MKRSFKRSILPLFLCFIGTVSYAQELRTTGLASSYPAYFNGETTASGETYNAGEYTAGHDFLPFGTTVKVTNLRNNEFVIVRINDRFPFKTNRLIDISNAAAKKIDLFGNVAPAVKIEVVEWPSEEAGNSTEIDKEGSL